MSERSCPDQTPPGPGAGEGLTVVELDPQPPPADHAAAEVLARREAAARLGEPMLLSWFDRDRDLESPAHASECTQPGAVPGYIVYALHREARLKIDIGRGRFVFFFGSGAL